MLSPPTRDIIGRSRHKHALDPSVVTLDFHATPAQNGEYLNPTGIGHPEFVEINLAALQTPLILPANRGTWTGDWDRVAVVTVSRNARPIFLSLPGFP
ncbi:MAG: hypothetical protein WBQ78_09505 [Gammaproteobacteria bacterium]